MEARRWVPQGASVASGRWRWRWGSGSLVTMPSVAWAEPADSGTRSGIDENPPVHGEGSVRPWIRKTRREAAGAHRAAPLKGQAKRRTAGWDLGMDAVARAGIAEGLASQLRALTQFLVDREA
jgi:hypothetical protein